MIFAEYELSKITIYLNTYVLMGASKKCKCGRRVKHSCQPFMASQKYYILYLLYLGYFYGITVDLGKLCEHSILQQCSTIIIIVFYYNFVFFFFDFVILLVVLWYLILYLRFPPPHVRLSLILPIKITWLRSLFKWKNIIGV